MLLVLLQITLFSIVRNVYRKRCGCVILSLIVCVCVQNVSNSISFQTPKHSHFSIQCIVWCTIICTFAWAVEAKNRTDIEPFVYYVTAYIVPQRRGGLLGLLSMSLQNIFVLPFELSIHNVGRLVGWLHASVCMCVNGNHVGQEESFKAFANTTSFCTMFECASVCISLSSLYRKFRVARCMTHG